MKISANDVRQVVFEGLRTLIRDPIELSDDNNIFELGVDSVAMMDLVMQIEDDLNISVPLDRIVEVETLGDLVKIIASILSGLKSELFQDIHELIDSFGKNRRLSTSLEADIDSEKTSDFPSHLSNDRIGAPKPVVWERVGRLLPKEKEKRLEILISYFDASGVPESERSGLIAKFEIEIARVTRPKWVGRLERGGELASLSAPLFLKRVHADYIGEGGTVENETIRAIDPDLMKAVEAYISARRTRATEKNIPFTLGDAEGLEFVLSRPGASSLVHGRNRPSA